MHMSGTSTGEIGNGQGPGAGSVPGGCNLRKFSEKIALHTQRQAKDTAAFREVMMDITSIRVQAERVRQTRGTVPYYGGSLPNVNQISRCSTETQFPCNSDPIYLTQQLLEADEGYRDIQPSPLARSHRRHCDSAPYLSSHLSPPRGPTWRSSNRNWSSCSATEKSQMVHLPLSTLNRTNSDSALHTSVRNTLLDGRLKSAQIRNPHARHSGMYAHPVPLIEENIQEETTSPKIKLSLMTSSGCETPVVHNFPLPEHQVSSLPVPSALSTSGSLPDLSSLHLPSALSVVQDSEHQIFTTSHSRTDHLSSTSTNPDIMADFNLPSLSSSLQACLSNPLLQSSLSSPSIQSSLSSHSLPSSLSSTSLRLSLSNSSLQSSPSNQSLQSSLSSSSLSNQSVQSSASHCSYSSGIGVSRSCSSSSLSGSPRVTGHAHATPSRKRAQLSPLIVPSGGESRWQHPKQFSPTVSPILSSITQGPLFNSNKVLKETKPPAYPCSQHQKTAPPMSHQPIRTHFQPEAQHQSIPEMEQWSHDHTNSQLEHQPQHQQTHSQTQQHLFNSQHHNYTQSRQHHSQPQTKYQQQLQHFAQQQSLRQHTLQQPLTQQQQHQLYTQANQQFQHHQLYKEQNQCTSQWLLPCQQGQYQGQQHQHHQQQLQPTSLPTQHQEKSWNRMTGLHGYPNTQVKRPQRACMQMQEQPNPQSKVNFNKTQAERSRISGLGEREIIAASPSSKDKSFQLNKESYVGLHLTPSQAKVLSQQLEGLQKEPLGGSRLSDLNCQAAESKSILPQHNQSYSAGETQNIFNISLSEQSSWLDQDISGLTDSVLEFDLENFGLDSEGLPSLEDLSYAQ